MAGNLKSRRKSLLRFLLIMVLLLVPTMLSAQRGNVSLNLQNEEVSQFIRQVEKQNIRLCIATTYFNPRRKLRACVRIGRWRKHLRRCSLLWAFNTLSTTIPSYW